MLGSAATLPLVYHIMVALGWEGVWSVVGVTFIVLGLLLLLPPICKLLRGEHRLNIEDDIKSLKATITGRALGLLLGLILGAPAITLSR
ncbi:hypothetical protein RC54_05945 [Herbaspirillum rubrisubalbicans]|uniref:Uncharacterized protein n=2 Tax=Herbaspirillum rubrisubalbicans TaxID=80842 RepID=A0AAD0UAI9_9BURK|nr:hypothetical protein RC54_05945 [Herbaspirillum rubrisubalbicans]